MTKKSKKKALKTGLRNFENFRSTTVCLDSMKDVTNPVSKATISPAKRVGLKGRSIDLPNLSESAQANEQVEPFRVYPLDLWFLISFYVHPLDIYTFCLICKSCHRIARTAAFWLRIYRQYVHHPKSLPVRLQPRLINVRPGLKTRVIRSLYFSYNIFKNRLHLQTAKVERVENLLCRKFWWEKTPSKKDGTKQVWKYHFKLTRHFQHPSFNRKPTSCRNFVTYNSELGCCLLVISSNYFIQMASTTGLVLTKFNAVVSSGDMRRQKVKMTFHNHRKDGKYHSHNAVSLNVDPVIDFTVVDWWHPLYPHPLDS